MRFSSRKLKLPNLWNLWMLSLPLSIKLIATGWVIAPLCGEESLDSAGQCTGEEPGTGFRVNPGIQ